MQFHISCFVVILNGLFSWLLFSVPILANEDPVLVAPGKLKKNTSSVKVGSQYDKRMGSLC